MGLRILTFFFVFGLFLNSSKVIAQTENNIKVAFIYNFIKHTRWPNEDKKTNVTIFVYKDIDFYNAAKNTYANTTLKNKPIKIIFGDDLDQARLADVVFIPESLNPELDNIAFNLRRTTTLLISSNSQNKKNVMINFIHNTANKSLSFEVNKSNIIYEQLQVSADLLLLGGTELDIAILYRENEAALRKIKNDETELKNRLRTMEKELTNASNQLASSSQKIEKNNKELVDKKRELEKLYIEVEKQKNDFSIAKTELTQSYKLKERELIERARAQEAQVLRVQETLKKQNNDVDLKEQEIVKMEASIVLNQVKINEQLLLLDQQKIDIDDQAETIKTKDTYLTITIFSIVLLIAFSLLIGLLFLRYKKTTHTLQNTLQQLEKTQTQLVHSEKMASLGLLTAGVAHEINTPLGVIVTSLSSVDDKVMVVEKAVEDNNISKKQLMAFIHNLKDAIKISTGSLERLTALIRNFKEVSADHAVDEVRTIELNNYIADIMNSLAQKLNKKGIKYELESSEPITIKTIPGAVAQVLTNLTTNAMFHAFHHQYEQKQSAKISISISKTLQDKIQIVFSDNGAGMTDEVLKNIYEPFYTTKRSEGGTGLGMNIVFNIVEQKLKGYIEIESELNMGTTITIELPNNLSED